MSDKVWNFKKPSLWKTQGLPITKPQISTLHKLKAVLKWDDATYELAVQRFGGGKSHTNELTRGQASAMIAELLFKSVKEKQQEKPKKAKAPKTSTGNVVVLANPMQMALIGHLIAEINWYEHGSYEAWLSTNMGIEKVATKEQAANVIEGLKGLKRHGHKKKP
jgi:hypothetical protein